MFDLGADPLQVSEELRRSSALAPLVASMPGLRVPGAWDPFELAVRAVLGQQVTVQGATTLAARLVARFGTPVDTGVAGLTHLFPPPEALAGADLATIGLPRARADALSALSRAVAGDPLLLDSSQGLDDAVARLRAIPGIGEWTAQYVAMRALGEPDAFPAADLGLRRAFAPDGAPLPEAALKREAEAWRPWRAYAAMYLWTALPRP
jgi:AraC family transcriptional regulator of adaptative response / DNA-3-methyladenine glycosylase II